MEDYNDSAMAEDIAEAHIKILDLEHSLSYTQKHIVEDIAEAHAKIAGLEYVLRDTARQVAETIYTVNELAKLYQEKGRRAMVEVNKFVTYTVHFDNDEMELIIKLLQKGPEFLDVSSDSPNFEKLKGMYNMLTDCRNHPPKTG